MWRRITINERIEGQKSRPPPFKISDPTDGQHSITSTNKSLAIFLIHLLIIIGKKFYLSQNKQHVIKYACSLEITKGKNIGKTIIQLAETDQSLI